MATTKLESSDKQIFEVEIDILKLSDTLKNLLEELGEPASAETIPVPNVDGATLKRVIQYLRHHATEPPREIEKPLTHDLKDVVSPWDFEFVSFGDDQCVFQLILAANYLNVKPLLELACAWVASQMRGKTTEQIRERFGIVNDFTPEEEQTMRENNKWVGEQPKA